MALLQEGMREKHVIHANDRAWN